MKKNLIKALIIIFLLSFAISAFTQSRQAMITVKKVLWALKRYKHDSRVPSQIAMNKKIKAYCNYVFNIKYMGRQAIADNWSKLNYRQKREYDSLLFRIVNKIVYKDASRQLNDMRLTYRGVRRISSGLYKVLVDIYIISEKMDIKAEYILKQYGRFYRVIDIYFDGESLVQDYRVEFNRIIRNHGVEGNRNSLLNRMRRTLRKNVIDDARKKKRQKKKQQMKRR